MSQTTYVKIEWTWRTESILHLGSGLSRAGVADALVKRLPNGDPALDGEAVKGACRMGAEHLASWLLGQPSPYEYGKYPAEPTRRPLARLFGDRAASHFRHGEFLGHGGRSARSFLVVEATAIDDRGTADDKSLRKVEVLAPGAEFKAGVEFWCLVEEREVLISLALAALGCAEWIGGRAGVGWGRVSVAGVQIEGATDVQSFLSPDKLNDLKEALSIESRPEGMRTDAAPALKSVANGAAPALAWYRLDVALREPACLPNRPEISNNVSTEDFLRASVLRGAFGEAWRRANLSETEIMHRLSEETRWLPAFPLVADGGEMAIPASKALMEEKRPTSRAVLVDTLSADGDRAAGDEIALKRTKARWVRPTASGWAVAETAERSVEMHVARNYSTGGKVTGALFSRQNLNPAAPSGNSGNVTFRSWVALPPDVTLEEHATIFVGKRVSANGRADVRLTRIDIAPGDVVVAGLALSTSQAVVLQLLSPALVRDPATGHSRRTLDLAWWQEWSARVHAEVHPDIASVSASSRQGSGRRGGFMSTWGHPRAAVHLIETGSTWRLPFANAADSQRFLDWFQRDCRQIGERQHEGFGWLAAWPGERDLSALPPSPANDAAARLSPESSWPGVGLDAKQRLEIATRVQQLPKNSLVRSRQALRDLASSLRFERGEKAKLAADVKRATQGRNSAWSSLAEGGAQSADQVIREYWRRDDDLRFLIELMLIRAGSV